MSKPHKKCIFCGLPRKMSKEHVWAEWIKAYLPMDLLKHSTLTAEVYKTHTDSRTKANSGDPRSRRLRVVCEDCNNGWMSRLQTAAKPYLLPLIEGKATILGEEAQRVISTWIAMFVMVAEFFTPDRASISPEMRKHLMDAGTVPGDWKIWIGNYARGKWPAHWIHHSLPVVDDIPAKDAPVPPPNTQTSTFVVGNLFVHAFSSSSTGLVQPWTLTGSLTRKLVQITPPKESVVVWNLTSIMDLEADNMAGAIFKTLDSIGRRYGY